MFLDIYILQGSVATW